MPVAVHFFLKPDQKRRLVAALKKTAETHEAALMSWVERVEAEPTVAGDCDGS